MERIKNSNQLRFERSKLLQRKADLEKAIIQDWGSLKDELKPGYAVSRLYHKFSKCRTKKETGFFRRVFYSWAGNYKKQWVTNAAQKLKGWFKN